MIPDIFNCPVCGNDESVSPCTGCGFMVRESGGIFDFTAGNACTALDEIDYDAVYAVDVDASFGYFAMLRDRVAPLLGHRCDTVIEIGAGTGFLSVPLARDFPCADLVITDVSSKMLAVCREKIARHASPPRGHVTYALLDGNRFCVKSASTDLVFGHGVLHHVFEYERLLADVRRVLCPQGIAVFVEPNYRFHVALLHILERVLGSVRLGIDLAADAVRLMQFVQHLLANWKFRGDRRFFAGLEDKHMFVRAELLSAARSAGFAAASAVPAYAGEDFVLKMRGYAHELGLSAASTQRILELVAREQLLLEDILDEECWSSADIYVFGSDPAQVPDIAGQRRPRDAARLLRELWPVAQRNCIHWVDQATVAADGSLQLSGWIASEVMVRHLEAAGDAGEVAVGHVMAARPDVLAHHGGDARFDAHSLACAGFTLIGVRRPGNGKLDVDVHFVDGASQRISLALPAARRK